MFAVECFVKTNCVVRAFGREKETAAEGKCQQVIYSGVGESMARNGLCKRISLEE